MKKFVMTLIISLLSAFVFKANTSSISNCNTSELNKMLEIEWTVLEAKLEIRRLQTRSKILDYVKDVGVKYKYSSKAKEFLTVDNIEVFLQNTEVYPSVIIAMAIIETGWGEYPIGNNYFGIKGLGHSRYTKEWNGSKFITIKSHFKEFDSKEENIRAVQELLNNPKYSISLAKTYKEAAYRVKAGGYATDPMYAYKIKFIIEKYELHRLDDIKNIC